MKNLSCFFTTVLTILLLNNIQINAVDRETVTAVPANDFLNTIGVNSSINSRGENITKTLECAEYMGFRWIRAGIPDGVNLRPVHFRWLLQRHVRVSCSIGNQGTIDDINNFVEGAKVVAGLGALIALEGPNEPNNWPVVYNGVSGGKGTTSWRPVAEWQRDMYAAVKADPVLKDYPVWNICENGAQYDNMGLQFLTIPDGAGTLMPDGTKYADYACCHNYFVHGSSRQNNQTWNASDPSSACPVDGLYGNYGNTWSKHFTGYTAEQLQTLPRVTTETGVTIDPLTNTEEIQALMYTSTYLAQFKRGWSYTAMYILRDRTDEGGNQTFGFYKPDYTPRKAATYMHNFTNILADTLSIETPSEFTYSISPARPATVHELLLQKNNGTLMLVVWGEKYVRGALADNITVDFDAPLEVVNVYNSIAGTEPVATYKNVSSIPLAMLNHPYILEINPVVTDIKNVNKEKSTFAAVYPNPVEDFMYVESSEGLKKVELFDLTGKTVLQLSDVAAGKTTLNVASLAKGSYLLRLTDGKYKTENHKIIKL